MKNVKKQNYLSLKKLALLFFLTSRRYTHIATQKPLNFETRSRLDGIAFWHNNWRVKIPWLVKLTQAAANFLEFHERFNFTCSFGSLKAPEWRHDVYRIRENFPPFVPNFRHDNKYCT